MKLLIEEYQYDITEVADVLDGLFTLQDVEQKVSVSYVGYYYNPHKDVRDVVFILPKVLLNEENKVFGKYEPRDLIHLEKSKITDNEKKFLYEFSVWIHRAIVVFNQTHPKNEIVLHRQIENEGKWPQKKKSNTLLDVILSLIHFNKEHQQFFTFILKNIHSGVNKINWTKTISSTSAVVQDESPTYLNPVNKKRMVNFEEELIVIFFSILHYIREKFGFRTKIPYGFDLITGSQFDKYLKGLGKRRLRQIKYKYFSDTAVKLWNLCYAYFDKAYPIRMSVSQSEYLLVKSFYVVFEAMIDELVGTPHNQLPSGLKDQKDGKIVDHMYLYEGLLLDNKTNNDIYYIGDSKYYKMGNNPGTESIFKQRTYARNVIQWNLDIWLNEDKRNPDNPYENVKLFDKVTEGYNIIPNFFISAAIDQDTLSYQDKTKPHDPQPPESKQFKNRLFDRDTLLISHYDVNFLFVLALYARDNSAEKRKWKECIRIKFRDAVQNMLIEKFDFYAMTAHPDVIAEDYFKTHFQQTLGKTYQPFENTSIFSLALDKKYPDENESLLAILKENFFVIDCPLGTNPEVQLKDKLNSESNIVSPNNSGYAFIAYVPDDEIEKYLGFNVPFLRSSSLPNFNIQEIKFIVPFINGTIIGYYDVTGVKFSFDDEKPRITYKLGKFHKLGEYWALVKTKNLMWLNYSQVVPLHKLKEIYDNAPKLDNYRLSQENI